MNSFKKIASAQVFSHINSSFSFPPDQRGDEPQVGVAVVYGALDAVQGVEEGAESEHLPEEEIEIKKLVASSATSLFLENLYLKDAMFFSTFFRFSAPPLRPPISFSTYWLSRKTLSRPERPLFRVTSTSMVGNFYFTFSARYSAASLFL